MKKMDKLILKFLQENGLNFTDKLSFSVVPKNQTGDRAISFFEAAKMLQKSPIELAKETANILNKCPEIEKTEIAGPYLNCFFNNQTFFKKVFSTPKELNIWKNRKIMVEFSSPNTNKPLHLGHMRNHAIGASIARIFEKCGAQVIRTAIFNDRGVHICKSMLAYEKLGNGDTPESTGEKPDHFVGKYYVKFEEESKKNPKLNDEVQEMLLAWEAGDEKVHKLWKRMNEWAFSGYDETYARQNIKFDKRYFESNLYKFGKEVVFKGLENGVFQKKPDGAVFIDLEEENLGEKILLRGNGTSVYMTQDLYTTIVKQQDFEPDEQIWVVADEQNYHFKVLFSILKKLKICNGNFFHLGYGLVNLPDGRMKSREGTVVDADNLMDELHSIAAEKIKEHNKDNNPQKITKIAEEIQNAAWRFFLLRTSPFKTITFDAKKSIDFQGATGPYLQYAGVRIKSILKKAKEENIQIKKDFFAEKFLGEDEKNLGVKILEFPNVLKRAAENKTPTFIATFLMELAQLWASFYDANSILNTEDENLKKARIVLAEKVLEILESGLDSLGIDVPEEM
jgi:arginyl-tRNA synthetase